MSYKDEDVTVVNDNISICYAEFRKINNWPNPGASPSLVVDVLIKDKNVSGTVSVYLSPHGTMFVDFSSFEEKIEEKKMIYLCADLSYIVNILTKNMKKLYHGALSHVRKNVCAFETSIDKYIKEDHRFLEM